MVGQPQADLGDAHGPLVELQTIELVHIHLGKCPDVEFSLKSAPLGKTGDQGLVLQAPDLAVGQNKKVATAAGWVKKAQASELLLELA